MEQVKYAMRVRHGGRSATEGEAEGALVGRVACGRGRRGGLLRPCGRWAGGQGGGDVVVAFHHQPTSRGAGVRLRRVVASMKLGFLGGSFDPIHLGHLAIAQDAHEGCGLDRLDFIPAAESPLKGRELTATGAQRLEMLRLALAGDARFGVLDLELQRGGTSYTVDTVGVLRGMFPGAELFWVIGTDQLVRLAEWKDIGELVRLVEFVHLARPGVVAAPAPAIPGLRLRCVVGHEVAISSSELRERANRGLPLWPFVPLKVADFIESQSLYRSNP